MGRKTFFTYSVARDARLSFSKTGDNCNWPSLDGTISTNSSLFHILLLKKDFFFRQLEFEPTEYQWTKGPGNGTIRQGRNTWAHSLSPELNTKHGFISLGWIHRYSAIRGWLSTNPSTDLSTFTQGDIALPRVIDRPSSNVLSEMSSHFFFWKIFF